MREKWFYDFMDQATVTEMAQSLHEYTTGSAEDYRGRSVDIAKALRHALETWKPATIPAVADYDESVRRLVAAALAEHDAKQSPNEQP